MNPTSKTTTITISGKKYELFFDLNTFSAFEEVTGIFFTDFLMDLREAFVESRKSGDPLSLFRKISVTKVRAIVWAALHTYDNDDRPVWPMTIHKLGRVLDLKELQSLLPAIMEGSADNAPEAPPEKEADEERPTETSPSTPESGGAGYGPSDEDVLASLDVK